MSVLCLVQINQTTVYSKHARHQRQEKLNHVDILAMLLQEHFKFRMLVVNTIAIGFAFTINTTPGKYHQT